MSLKALSYVCDSFEDEMFVTNSKMEDTVASREECCCAFGARDVDSGNWFHDDCAKSFSSIIGGGLCAEGSPFGMDFSVRFPRT